MDVFCFIARQKCPTCFNYIKNVHYLSFKCTFTTMDKLSFKCPLNTKGHIWTLCPSMDIMFFDGHNVQICPFFNRKNMSIEKDILSFSKRTFCPFKKGHFVPHLTFRSPTANDEKGQNVSSFLRRQNVFFLSLKCPFFFPVYPPNICNFYISFYQMHSDNIATPNLVCQYPP